MLYVICFPVSIFQYLEQKKRKMQYRLVIKNSTKHLSQWSVNYYVCIYLFAKHFKLTNIILYGSVWLIIYWYVQFCDTIAAIFIIIFFCKLSAFMFFTIKHLVLWNFQFQACYIRLFLFIMFYTILYK